MSEMAWGFPRFPPRPTAEECEKKEPVSWQNEIGRTFRGFACWYPQMSGSVARCVVLVGVDFDVDGLPGGFDAFIWHDGEFPFAEDRHPIKLHHCSATQFVEFGNTVQREIEKLRKAVS